MKSTEQLADFKVNIQSVDITVSDEVKETLSKSLNRLDRIYEKIEWTDVYFEDKPEKSTKQKQVSIRLWLPGKDGFASEYGDNFHQLITDVEDKLRKQLEKKHTGS